MADGNGQTPRGVITPAIVLNWLLTFLLPIVGLAASYGMVRGTVDTLKEDVRDLKSRHYLTAEEIRDYVEKSSPYSRSKDAIMQTFEAMKKVQETQQRQIETLQQQSSESRERQARIDTKLDMLLEAAGVKFKSKDKEQ